MCIHERTYLRKILRWIGSAKGQGAGFSLLSAGNLLIAFITYLRFAEIAGIFGTTWQTDAVSIAMVIPLLLQQLISTAFGAVFMPIYSRVRLNQDREAANRLVSRIIYWMAISGVFLIALVYASGSLSVRIVGPGVEQATTILATKLLWIFLPLIFLNAIEGVLQNFLTYGKRYGLISFVRVLQILVSYLVLLLGHEKFGIMIIPISGLVGGFVSFSVCAVIAFRFRLRLHPVLNPRDKDFKELVKLAVPITIGVLTGFLGPVADKALASFLIASSVTAIDYATRIKNLVRVILIQPVTILSTVSFSKTAAEKNMEKLKSEIASFIKYISYYAVPASGILVILSVPLISVFFQRDNFGPEQTQHVGYALAFYSPWFAQFGIGLIVRRAFFSLKEPVIPVVLGIWAMLSNILLNVILLQPLGIAGLALATTLTSTAKTLFQLYFLRKRLGGINGSVFIPEILRILAATAVMMVYIIIAGKLFPVDLYAVLSSRIYNLTMTIVPGIVLYVAVTALIGSKTYRMYADSIKRILSSWRKQHLES